MKNGLLVFHREVQTLLLTLNRLAVINICMLKFLKKHLSFTRILFEYEYIYFNLRRFFVIPQAVITTLCLNIVLNLI